VLSITQKADQFRAMTSTLLDQVQIGESELDREKLLVLPEDVLLPVIHLFIEQSGNAAVTSGELGQVRNIKNLQTGSRLRFSNDFELIRDRDTLRLNRLFNRTGLSNTEKVDESDLPHKFMVGEIEAYLSVESWTGEIRAGELQLDYSKVEWPITVRPWRDGDKIQPFGMKGHKLISDLLTDKKVPADQKKAAILIESFDGIICAVIFPHNKSNMEIGVISDQFRCTNTTEQILRIDTDSEPDGSISS
jgi:tRNA(Ile)-lysidine synthase